jgi:hypothetical protein
MTRSAARLAAHARSSPQAGLRRTRPKRARYLCSTAGVCRLTRRPRRARIGRTRSRGRAGPDDPDRGQAITRLAGGARVLAVETDRPGTATVAAGRRDYSRVADEARCLQSGVERDPQLALSRSPALPLSRSRKRRKADVLAATGRSIKRGSQPDAKAGLPGDWIHANPQAGAARSTACRRQRFAQEQVPGGPQLVLA